MHLKNGVKFLEEPYSGVIKKSSFGDSLTKIDVGSIPSLMGNISDGVLMVDDQGVISFVNERFCQLLGYDEQQLKGLTFMEAAAILFEESSYSWVNAKLQKVFKGQNQFFRHKWKNRMGSFVPVEIEMFPTFNGNNAIIGSLLVIKDIYSKLLLDITATVNSTLELAEVLSSINKIIVERLGITYNAIFLLDDEKKELVLTSSQDTPNNQEKLSGSANAEMLDTIIRDRVPTYLNQSKGISKTSLVGYPLICKEKDFGVIAFGASNIKKFSAAELELFHSISNQVAMAICNAKLYQKLEYMSLTDGLTGLYNHKYFKKQLKAEVAKAKGKYGVSLLMIDVDDFKKYNDNFGPLAGDLLLERLARILKNNMHSRDVVARYGGEEFAIILIESEPLAALNTAERVRQAVERYRFSGRELQPEGKLTISIGVSCCPIHASNTTKLLETANKALYEAKKIKNNIIMAE